MTDLSRFCLILLEAWEDAKIFRPGAYEDENVGASAAWRPGTIEVHRGGCGRWLNFLRRSNADLTVDPADRVTPASATEYLAKLEGQGLSLKTRCNRLNQLMGVMMAFAPERDWSWLRRRCTRLAARAAEHRRQRPLKILSGDILDKSLRALRRLQRGDFDNSTSGAAQYRNWLMVALATLAPLRRRNLVALSIARHLRLTGTEWSIEIPACESKTHKPISMPIPAILHPLVRYYIDTVRPILLGNTKTDRLWVTMRHAPMTYQGFYIAMRDFTRAVFGAAINPHKFRYTAATSTVIASSEKAEATRALLGHRDRTTTEDFYIIGHSLQADDKPHSSQAFAGGSRVSRPTTTFMKGA